MQKKLITGREAFSADPWKKEPSKRLVKCIVWNVVLYGAEIGHYDGMSRNDWKHFTMDRVKWKEKIKM